MTRTFATSAATNDLYRGADGNLVLLKGLPAIEAACATASKSILGEQVLSTGAGLPMFEAIWTGVPNVPLYESYLQKTLSNVSGVNSVGQINSTIQDGDYSYTADIDTDEGAGTATATVQQ